MGLYGEEKLSKKRLSVSVMKFKILSEGSVLVHVNFLRNTSKLVKIFFYQTKT